MPLGGFFVPISLPEISKPSRTSKKLRRTPKNDILFFENPKKKIFFEKLFVLRGGSETYIVFHGESESEVENLQILHFKKKIKISLFYFVYFFIFYFLLLYECECSYRWRPWRTASHRCPTVLLPSQSVCLEPCCSLS